MPRFVLLYHDCPPNYDRPSHWDLMLECGDKLRTWALAALPSNWQTAHTRTREEHPGCPPLAESDEVITQQLADHRRDYLEFEGNLTNNRGRVIRVEEGTLIEQWETALGWYVSLKGNAIDCSIELDQCHSDESLWTLSIRELNPDISPLEEGEE